MFIYIDMKTSIKIIIVILICSGYIILGTIDFHNARYIDKLEDRIEDLESRMNIVNVNIGNIGNQCNSINNHQKELENAILEHSTYIGLLYNSTGTKLPDEE